MIQVVVSGLAFPVMAITSARIGGTYRALGLPSVWIPVAVGLLGGAVAGAGLVTNAGLVMALGSAACFAGWLIAFIRLATLNGKFVGLMARLTKYLDPTVQPVHVPLVEKDFLELRRLVLQLRPTEPDGEAMLRQIDDAVARLRHRESLTP